jgi:hypothetical protein
MRAMAGPSADAVALSRSGNLCRKRPQAKIHRAAHFTPPKAAGEDDDDAFGAHVP